MTKEFEALERLAMPDDLHIKECKKLGIGLTEDYDLLKQVILELTSIKKVESSEALNVLKATEKYTGIDLTVVKNALLKAQEPKHYLKWEDLEFTYGTKTQKVRMNDTIYKIVYANYDNTKEVGLLSEDEKCYYLGFTGNYKDNVQLFNDLHLEVLE